MTYLPAAAHERFAAQHGVASSQQLVEGGLSLGQIEYLVERGALVNVVRGTYATPSVHLTESSHLAAICLARPAVAIAGPTAGRLHGLRKMTKDQRIHLIAPPGANPSVQRNVRTFHTLAFAEHDLEERDDGIRVTTLERTSLDLARHLRADALLSVVEQVIQKSGATDAELRAMAIPWLPRRPWVRRYLDVLDRRIAGPAAESDPEVVVGQMLLAEGLSSIVRQHPIELAGYGSARFDIAIPEIRWALEVDVFPSHAEIGGIESDRRRDEAAARIGWAVDRISRNGYEHHLVDEIERVVSNARRLQCMLA